MTNSSLSLLLSAVRAATTTTNGLVNYHSRGVHLVIDVTAVPGVDTITPKLQAYDQSSGKWYDLLVGSAISTIGTTVLKLYPSITAVANAAANDFLPLNWRVVITHSAASNFTYSVAANLGV